MSEKSYFPISIQLVESDETRIVRTVTDIPNGISFKVLKTCVPEQGLLTPGTVERPGVNLT